MNETYLIPRWEFRDDLQKWEAWIEERGTDEANDVVFAWHEGYFHTPQQAFEAVTTEYVRMSLNQINYSETD